MKRAMQTIIIIIFISFLMITVTVFIAIYASFFGKDFDKRPPTIPSDLKSTGDTADTIDLNWGQSHDEKGGSGFKEYIIYSIEKDGPREVGRTDNGEYSSVQYSVEDLVSQTDYRIQVSAIDNAGNESKLSNMVYVKTDSWEDGDVPDAPTNIRYKINEDVSVGRDHVDLMWDPGKDETSGIWKYRVYNNRSSVTMDTPSGDGWTEGDETEVTLLNLDPDTLYSINIKSYDKAYQWDPIGHVSGYSENFSFKTKS